MQAVPRSDGMATSRVRRDRTLTVSLPGKQMRLRQMILYVAKRCEDARFFGAIKLNKIIWKADFNAYADRGVPVTGREYRRQKLGPTLREMRPLQTEMLKDTMIKIDRRKVGDFIEQRTIALVDPDMSLFTSEDIAYVDRSIEHYWSMTGTETSDESHGVAWKTRANGEAMPYESALLSDRSPRPAQMERLEKLIRERMLSTE